jgi:hypothetical protein
MLSSSNLLLAIALVGSSLAVAQQPLRTSDECRRIAAVLVSPASDSAWHTALASIYDCPDHVGPTLAALWRALPSDSVRRRQLVFVSAHIQDADLYRALSGVARDATVPDSIRFQAMEVLVTLADSTKTILVRPPLSTLRETTVPHPSVAVGAYTHPFARRGRHPLPLDVRDSVIALLRELHATDSSQDVRYVARRAHEWLASPPTPQQR